MKLLGLIVVAVLLSVGCGDDASSPSADPADQEEECLVTEDTATGDGEEATSGDIVTVHYTGTLDDGTEFDSSRGKEPFTFPLGAGQVIQGWDEGIQGMRVGGQRTLTICSDMAYGEDGFPPVIPAGATLHFDVELKKVQKP